MSSEWKPERPDIDIPNLTEEEKRREIDSLRKVAEYWRTHETKPMTKRTISYPCGCEYDFYDGILYSEDETNTRLCKQHDSYVNEEEK